MAQQASPAGSANPSLGLSGVAGAPQTVPSGQQQDSLPPVPIPLPAAPIPETAFPLEPGEAGPPTSPPPVGDPANGQRPFGSDAYATFGELSPFYNPAVGHAPLRADYRATWYGSEPVSGQPTNLGYVQHDFGLSFPIWQCGTDEWTAGANVRAEIFHTNAILPSTLQPFPDELWNIRFNTSYRHQFDNGWIGGGTVSVGSASDKPFHSIQEMTAGVNAYLRVPQGDHNAWLFSLAYSPTSELPFPIPGVAFVYQPSENFRVNIGLPFQMMWRPIDDLTLDFSYMLLRTVHARATYRLSPLVRAYVSYDWGNEGYFLADRPNDNDRFYYYDMRLTGGIQVMLVKNFSVDISGGYVFDRFYFEGQQFSDNNFNRVDVGNGPFVSIQGRLRW